MNTEEKIVNSNNDMSYWLKLSKLGIMAAIASGIIGYLSIKNYKRNRGSKKAIVDKLYDRVCNYKHVSFINRIDNKEYFFDIHRVEISGYNVKIMFRKEPHDVYRMIGLNGFINMDFPIGYYCINYNTRTGNISLSFKQTDYNSGVYRQPRFRHLFDKFFMILKFDDEFDTLQILYDDMHNMKFVREAVKLPVVEKLKKEILNSTPLDYNTANIITDYILYE